MPKIPAFLKSCSCCPGWSIINDKMAETQGVWNWSFPGRPQRATWAVDNSVDNVDKWSLEFGV